MHLAVGEGVQQDGAGGFAVASGAADLLVVSLDRARQGDVDDGADVGLVDAHARRRWWRRRPRPCRIESRLNLLANAGFEAGVVGGGAASEHSS